MSRAVVAFLSDPHLSRRRGYSVAAWRYVTGRIADLAPAATIVAGDLVLDDCDNADDRAFAAEAVRSLGDETFVVPGNHDIGDNVAEPWMRQRVTAERMDAFLAAFDQDRFAIDKAGWRIIGVNVQIFGTGLPREEDQWTWLEEIVKDAGHRPLVLVLHKPFAVWTSAEGENPNCIDGTARARLTALMAKARLRLVVSGHYHHHRTVLLDGITHLWLPSIAMVGRKSHGLEPFAQRSPGFVAVALDGEDASFALVPTPPALVVDPAALASAHGGIPRDWPLFKEQRAPLVFSL